MEDAKTCDWPACTEPSGPGGPGYAIGPNQPGTAEYCRAHGELWEQMVDQQRLEDLRKLAALLHR